MSIGRKVELCPATGNGQRNTGVRTIFMTLLLTGALFAGGLMAGPANAAAVAITTTGTITSGTETGGLFGLPTATTSLVGDSYSLTVGYNLPGPNFFTDGSGNSAFDFESSPGLTGYVAATVNGQTLKVDVTGALSSFLAEDLFDLDAGTQGNDAAGNFVNVTQALTCGNACVPFADLQTMFTYLLQASDFGQDSYLYEAAGFPDPSAPTATFLGTENSLVLQVPEPDSWILLAAGLLGLGMVVRRRRA